MKTLVAIWDSISENVNCSFRIVMDSNDATEDLTCNVELLTPDSEDWRLCDEKEKDLMMISLFMSMYECGGDFIINKELGEKQIKNSN